MRKNFITLIIALCFIMFGAIMTFYEVLNFEVSNEIVNYSLSKKTITYDLTNINNKIEIHTPLNNTDDIFYDNTISPGNYKIVVTYYNELLGINKYSTVDSGTEYVEIDVDDNASFDTFKKFIDITIEGLKENKVYNYSKALKPEIKVYINEVDKDNIRLVGIYY